jgi:hypothetical protein
MRADNSAHLAISARRRHETTRAKAIQAIRELDTNGTRISFDAIARHARISRSWLYTQPDIRAEITRLREAQPPSPTAEPALPQRQRASDTSHARRLEIALTRNRDLSTENQRLRGQLARAFGQLRAAGVTTATQPAPHDTIR